MNSVAFGVMDLSSIWYGFKTQFLLIFVEHGPSKSNMCQGCIYYNLVFPRSFESVIMTLPSAEADHF